MRRTTAMILTSLFAALTAAGAFIRIPTPVSAFTMQLLFTAMAGVLLGRKWGAISQLVYVLLGLAGLPVFTSGGGVSALVQPTGGFLFGMIAMAWVCGWVAERRGVRFSAVCLAGLAGLTALYLIGLPYMHIVLTVWMKQDWSVSQTILAGMAVFLPWDALKLLLAGVLCSRVYPVLYRK